MAPALYISIPSTSVCNPAQGKSFTQYRVVLQLPLRKHEVNKRYNDFASLHHELIARTGAAPPAPLPAKSWLRQTLNNAALTEQRRKDLEQYVKAILEAEDTRWRSSDVWRAFLSLPATAKSSEGRTATSTTIIRDTGAVTDPNEWLDKHRELKTQLHTARHQLKQRDTATTAQEQHACSTESKASLIRAATTIAHLGDGLNQMTASGKSASDAGWQTATKLGAGEIRRRKDLLAAARSEVEGLEGVLRSVPTRSLPSSGSITQGAAVASDVDKAGLWAGTEVAKPRGRVLGGGPLKETERTRELGNQEVVQLQQQILKEQDEDVLSLGKTVARLKDMGLMINEELTIQNEMLGLLDEDTDRVQGKIDVARRRINKIR